MSQNQALKMLTVILLSFFIIAGATQAGPLLLPGSNNESVPFSQGTVVGSTDVSGLSQEEAVASVSEDIAVWKQQSSLKVSYGEEVSVLSPELIEFFPEEAVSTAVDGESNPVQLNVKMGDVITLLKRDFGLPESDVLDPMKVQNEIEQRSAFLESNEITSIPLSNLLSAGSGETLIAEAAGTFTVTAGQQNYLFANESVTLSPGQYYSVLNLSEAIIETSDDYEISDEELSKIATVIHEAVLDTPLTIAERHISTRLPEYASPGKEARVTSSSGNDYKVLNATESEFTVQAESVQGTLYIRVTGPEQPFTFSADISESEVLPFRTIRQYSPFVADGATEVPETGIDGQLIPVERVTLDADSIEIERELLYEDFYPPVHRVEVSSLESPEQQAEDDQDSVDTDGDDTSSGNDSGTGQNGSNNENNDNESVDRNDSDNLTDNHSGSPSENDNTNNPGSDRESSSGEADDDNSQSQQQGRNENGQNRSTDQNRDPK
ncbi:VanW family protein [Jeotgalibacillus salarius]|uniref:G5 domain-containing protein n=1 Tax=Jeotgalibacillus salarius TaxID=546023 RepID=A0A4Y8LEB7_9BACL|nr:VanW family protein [Jeotgalibacillus salarius]TFE01015.1 hypothetical protein E2626_10130 [Jeotgalibacillus salarius]